MSKWCDACYRNEITGELVSCNSDCPVFGKHFEELAKIVIENEVKKTKHISDIDVMKQHISFFGLSTQANNALLKAKIDTVEKLCNKTYLEAYKIRGFGECSLKKVIEVMQVYNLHFLEEDY